MAQHNESFAFGKNWERFIRGNFTEERVSIAQKHLLGFLGVNSLQDAAFIDIGSGSGIHSLAACKAGAKRIVSFDYDQQSVATTRKIHEMHGSPPSWVVLEGSILDKAFIAKLEPADVVYSWGVLHHTGNLWQAMENAASLVQEGGLFYIAVYEKTRKTPYWIRIKKFYNRSPWLIKKIMEIGYVWWGLFRQPSISKIRASLQYIRTYQKSRGMEFWTDVKDWLGGWPYEPATQAEVCDFCTRKLGLVLVRVQAGEENIEYLFCRKTQAP